MRIGNEKISVVPGDRGILIRKFDEEGNVDFTLTLTQEQAFEFCMEIMQAIYKTGYQREKENNKT